MTIYKYCPRCGKELTKQTANFYLCSNCDFHLYINPIQTTTAILENKKGDIMLVKRRSDPKKGFWDLPGGFTNLNESSELSLVRELKEELSIDLKKFSYFKSFIFFFLWQSILKYNHRTSSPFSGNIRNIISLYSARNLG